MAGKTKRDISSLPKVQSSVDPHGKPVLSRRLIVIFVLLVFAMTFLVKNGLLIAAVVNGRPIFRWELTNALVSRFGKQTLEGIISERIIAGAARKEGVGVTKGELDAKINDVVGSLGKDVKLEDLLAFQGMTKADFENQIRLQLTVEKILGKDIEITEADIDNYIATNRATLAATEPATLREEARKTIMNQKVSEKIQPWFLEIKDKAKVFRLL